MGGQKPSVTTSLMLSQKLKQKKFQKKRFLDFVFNPQFFHFLIKNR